MKQWQALKEKLLGDKLLLLLFSGGEGKKQKTQPAATESELCAALEQTLETRLTKLLSSVEGVGKVKVLVTVERLQEYTYAQNSVAGGAGERTENDYVIVEQNGSKSGLPLTVTAPVVRGVAVACEGGGSARVRQEVVNLVCAALDIGASKVYVAGLAR